MRKRREGYIKAHVAVDTKTKQVVSMEIRDDRTRDGEKLKSLVEKAREKVEVKRVFGEVVMARGSLRGW